MPKVFFQKEFREIEVPKGANLRKVALDAGISIDRPQLWGVTCRGMGLCGLCKVWVREREANATNERGFLERWMFFRFFDGWRRLACRVRVQGDVDVWTSPGEESRIGAPRDIAQPVSPVAEARARGEVTTLEEEKAAAAAAKAREAKKPDDAPTAEEGGT